MSELNFMVAEFSVIQARSDELVIANEQAHSLEKQADELREGAKVLRTDADEERTLAFEAASETLLDGFNNGTFSALEVVRAITHLEDLDPEIVRLHREKRGDRIASAFEALQPETPVILSADEGYNTGIVSAPVKVSELHVRKKSRRENYIQPFMAPWAKIAVPLRTLNRDGELQETTTKLELGRLISCTVGRAALQELVNQAGFETRHDNVVCHPGVITNTPQLTSLSEKIVQLQKLGMQGIDTRALRAAIDDADAYAHRRQKVQNIRRTSRYRHEVRYR